MVVGHPGLAQYVQVGLAMQVRCEVAVDPCVVGLRGHLDVLSGRRGQPAHQLGLHVAVDLAFVDFDAVEPAVVLLKTEQRAGVVEQDGLNIPIPPWCQV